MKKYQSFLSESFQFLIVKFSIYLNRHASVMPTTFKAPDKVLFFHPESTYADIFLISPKKRIMCNT